MLGNGEFLPQRHELLVLLGEVWGVGLLVAVWEVVRKLAGHVFWGVPVVIDPLETWVIPLWEAGGYLSLYVAWNVLLVERLWVLVLGAKNFPEVSVAWVYSAWVVVLVVWVASTVGLWVASTVGPWVGVQVLLDIWGEVFITVDLLVWAIGFYWIFV